jgi:hypothetical protein
MLTEFEVRRRIDAIRASRMSPIRKAKMLLRLNKSLNRQVKSLLQARAQISQTSDLNAAAGLTRMTTTTQQLLTDVQEAAYEAISVVPRGTLTLT